MILYHGSNVIADTPKILKSEKGRDFGFAFYLTPIKEQAERMAKRKQKLALIKDKNAKAIVSVFEWDEDVSSFAYKKFIKPDGEWLSIIIKCRCDINYVHGFDIVEGKIADDSVGETVGYVVRGIMRIEDAIEKLKYQKINSQIAFCSEDSLKTLKFVTSYEVK